MKLRRNKSRNNKASKHSPRPTGPKFWMTVGAIGALTASSAFNPNTAGSAYAISPRSSFPALYFRSQAQAAPFRFDILPGPLDAALSTFQHVTGWKVLLDKPEIGSIHSQGLSGSFTIEQGLKLLLSGTGVAHRFTGPQTITLDVSGPSSSINVTGPAAALSSSKYTEPLRDLPQTVAVIHKAVIEEQGATTLRDVLRNVPGLTIAAGEGGAPAGDNLTLRGFSARNDVFVDGVRDLSPQARDPFNLEQVEVVKGPASAYNGRGSTGGTINLVSKAPALAPFYGLTLNLGTDQTRRVTADLNLPLDRLGLGKHTALRFNFLAHESGVAGRDVVENNRWGAAPSLAFGLGTPARLTLSYFKLKQDNISDYGIPWVPATNNALREFRDRPAPVPRETFYGLKDRDLEKLNSDLATVRVDRDFGDALTLRNQFRYGRSTRDSMATPPRFAGDDTTAINREMRSWVTEDEIWDNQADLRASFVTAGLEHTLVSGVALTRERNERTNRTAPNMVTTLLNPDPNDRFTGEITVSPQVGDVRANSVAAFAFDTVKLGQKVELSGGLRWDYFDVEGVNTAGVEVARIDRMLSWRAGAVYKPRTNGSLYAAYGTSLNPSLEGLSYQTANAAIEPEKTYTLEVGTKWDLMRERLLVSVAGFRVEKSNARTPGLLPDDPPQVLEGEQRVYGAEVGVTGRVSRDWMIFAAYTYLDSEIERSNTLTEVGKELLNTPKNSVSVWSSYRLGWKLDVGGGLRFVDDRYGNNTNTRRVGSYTTIDAMATRPVTEHIDLRLNLYNLNNAYYFDRVGGGHLVPGAARSVNVSLNFHF